MKKFSLFTIGLGLTILMAACTVPEVTGVAPNPGPTSVYATVSAQLTLTARPTISIPTLNLTPVSQTSTVQLIVRTEPPVDPTRSPTLTRIPIPCNLAASNWPTVDITVPDGTRFKPGESFSKTWRLMNAGSCPWTKDYNVVWFSGENFSAARDQGFSYAVSPGGTVDITVDMIAPRQAGIHQSNWKLRDAKGTLFGIGPTGDAPFWVRIEVGETAAAIFTPQPSATVTPTLSTASKGSVELHTGQSINLDTGKVGTGAGDDLSLQKLDANIIQLAAVNGAMLSDFGQKIPTDQDCRNPNLVNSRILSTTLKVDEYLCMRTTQGLPGYIWVKSLVLKDELINLDYLIWAIP